MGEKARTALIAPLLVLLAVPLALYFLSTGTRMQIDPPIRAIGDATPMRVHVFNPHGVRKLIAGVEQDGKRYVAQITTSPPHRFLFLRRNHAPADLILLLGKKSAPGLHDGKAKVFLEAQSNDLRAITDTVSFDVDVI